MSTKSNIVELILKSGYKELKINDENYNNIHVFANQSKDYIFMMENISNPKKFFSFLTKNTFKFNQQDNSINIQDAIIKKSKIVSDNIKNTKTKEEKSQKMPRTSINNEILKSLNELNSNIIKLTEIIIVKFDALDKRFDNLEKKFDGLDKRFDNLEKKFDSLDKKLDNIDKKLDNINKKLDNIDKKLDGLDKRFDNLEKKFDGLDKRFDNLEKNFESLGDKIDKIND